MQLKPGNAPSSYRVKRKSATRSVDPALVAAKTDAQVAAPPTGLSGLHQQTPLGAIPPAQPAGVHGTDGCAVAQGAQQP
jgi:hypothetical protein